MACLCNMLSDIFVGFLFWLVVCELSVNGQAQIYATCKIVAGSGVSPTVYGTVNMHQKSGGHIEFDVSLKGFPTSESITQHGFHIHDGKSIDHKCNDSLGHYNPEGKTHGAPEDEERHVGDLGNVNVSTGGEVNVKITDRLITLFGIGNVLGRAFVVHEKVDDLGRGNFSDSKTTGHAGARLGCCIITQTAGGAGNKWSEVQSTIIAMLFLASLISIY